ncbi:RNA-directed DNA polymerase [Deinococcus sp. UYEF24]
MQKRSQREAIFSADKLKKSWSSARDVLKQIPLMDAFEYHDVNSGINDLAASVSFRIISGDYESLRNDEFRTEKKNGITRRIVIMFPEDALIFSCMNNNIEPLILKIQPNTRACYIRNKPPKSVSDMQGELYPHWSKVWAKFQDEIYQFSKKRAFTVVTDVASYYDTINLNVLREKIGLVPGIENSTAEFIFDMLNRFVWKPEYAIAIFQGLPQVNFPAIRLIAHYFLFDIDDYMFSRTSGDYVRWMDDIDFGVDNIVQGKKILMDLEILLNSVGVRLNTGKTKIMSSLEAEKYFCISQNVQANFMKNQIDQFDSLNKIQRRIIIERMDKYVSLLLDEKPGGAWEKVLMRYINMYSKIKTGRGKFLDPYLLIENPSLRSTPFRYYRSLDYSNRRSKNLVMYMLSPHCLDDSSFSEAIDVFIDWKITKKDKYIRALLNYFENLNRNKELNVHRISCGIRFIVKFSDSATLAKYIENFVKLWPESEWLSRQVAAVAYLVPESTQRRIRYLISNSGRKEGMRVLHTLDNIKESSAIYSSDKGVINSKKSTVLKLAILSAYMQSGLTEDEKKRVFDRMTLMHRKDIFISMRAK